VKTRVACEGELAGHLQTKSSADRFLSHCINDLLFQIIEGVAQKNVRLPHSVVVVFHPLVCVSKQEQGRQVQWLDHWQARNVSDWDMFSLWRHWNSPLLSQTLRLPKPQAQALSVVSKKKKRGKKKKG
jgi:hypothetical protein